MVNLIVGENAVGKTKCLYGLSELTSDLCITDRMEPDRIAAFKLDERCIQVINDITGYCVHCSPDYLDILNLTPDSTLVDKGISRPEFYKLLTLISKCANTFYLDEPDVGMTFGELVVLTDIIQEFSEEFNKTFWITTHNPIWLRILKLNFYTIDENRLVQIREGDASEMLLPL